MSGLAALLVEYIIHSFIQAVDRLFLLAQGIQVPALFNQAQVYAGYSSRPREAGALPWMWNLPCPRRQAAESKREPSAGLHANTNMDATNFNQTTPDITYHFLLLSSKRSRVDIEHERIPNG
jgi:hypothetical protein